MTATYPTLAPARRACVGRLAALFTATLALAANLFAHPPAARADYDPSYYDWCIKTGQGYAYCCSQAGGIVSGSKCDDPASRYTQPPPTLDRNPGPGIIVLPPGTIG